MLTKPEVFEVGIQCDDTEKTTMNENENDTKIT